MVEARNHGKGILSHLPPPFESSNYLTSIQWPDTESQVTPTHSAHMWCLREIECDITLGLYYPLLDDAASGLASKIEPWRTSMQTRLEAWYQTVRQSASLSEKIEFHELLFQIQLLRLNRPSPRCAKPTRNMRKRALNASIVLIKEYSILDRLGKMFMLWHAAYCVAESGVYLLSYVLTEVASKSADRQHMEGEDVSILAKHIKTFSSLMGKISRRWPSISPYASTLGATCSSVLNILRQWSTGQTVPTSDYFPLREELDKMGTLSSTASPRQVPINVEPQSELYLPLGTSSQLQGHTYTTFDSANFPIASNEAVSLMNAGWMGGQLSLDPSFSVLPEPYAIDYNDPMTWDFSGIDSEEIFAAMLEGGSSDLDASMVYPSQL